MPLEFEALREDDRAHRDTYNDAFNAVWPEFALSDAEFVHELEHSGPARRWLVRRAGALIGTLAVERIRWNDDNAPPLAFVLLNDDAAEPVTYVEALQPALDFVAEQGFDELRVLCWDREEMLTRLLESLDGWSEVERELDVGLEVAAATGWQRPVPEGIRMTTIAERPDLLEAVHACLEVAVADIPGDEPETVPPFDEWQRERAVGSRDDATFVALAIDHAGQETIAGYAELEFRDLLDGLVWHGYTAVHPQARGRGVAYALKAAAIEYAQRTGVRQLRTENEERNAPIRHINETLGYRPVAARIILRGPLAPLRG